jgi:hypothetical protein
VSRSALKYQESKFQEHLDILILVLTFLILFP